MDTQSKHVTNTIMRAEIDQQSAKARAAISSEADVLAEKIAAGILK